MGAPVPPVTYADGQLTNLAAPCSTAFSKQQHETDMSGTTTSNRERTPRLAGRQICGPKQRGVVRMLSPECELRAQPDLTDLTLEEVTAAVVR